MIRTSSQFSFFSLPCWPIWYVEITIISHTLDLSWVTVLTFKLCTAPLTEQCFQLSVICKGKNINKRYFWISTWFIHNNGVLIIEASSEWIFLGVFTVLAWVVRRCIILTTRYITIQWIAWFVFLSLIHWIVIYLADSVLQILKNWALDYDGFSVQSDYI